jgi:hypothetical protein
MEQKQETKNCQNCKKDFTIEPEDFNFYEKIKVSPPTFCPECRMQRRYAWRNVMSLYNNKCALCKKPVVTLYSLSSGITVYCNKCWWSDKWDPKSYAIDYDFSKPFFVQFNELMKRIPHMAVVNDDGIASFNCEYTHDWWFSKNCYMSFSGWHTENVMYSFNITAGKDIVDCMINLADTQFIYECINCTHSYEVKNSFFSRACINSQFLYDCQDCSDCFMCSGLRSKKYFFKNKQYTEEEYENILKNYGLDTFSGVEKAQKEYNEFILKYPRRYAWMKQVKNCDGDVVSYSKNTKKCFMVKNFENCKYCDFCESNKDSYDLTVSSELSECYEGIVLDHSQLNLFGIFSPKCQDVKYVQYCNNCKYVFGCNGLRNSNYCILNKQYTKEEYEKLMPKIIKHMNNMPYVDKKRNKYCFGEFFPAELSPFGYNETQAPEQFPLEKEEVIKNGYNWQENVQRTTGKETLKPENIPDSINNVDDSILDKILVCIECKRNYKIVPNELIFYRKMKIPIPRRCFYCRHANRVKSRNPFKLWHRKCMKEGCENEFETSYAPDRPEIVYCEKCYQQEVY